MAGDEQSVGGGVGPAGGGGEGGSAGGVQDLQIERELQDAYLTYAMSTIMDRALPDVRDGLKPSQRRILVAMNDLKLYPGKKHIKCAKICGDTSGNYHPHGDAVIYPALVNMGQDWRMRVTLIDPQGNFGSIEPDGAAAMRYTEARLTHAAADMLADIAMDTVDFQATFDARLSEPTVLPGKFPHLLVNGGVGIAVGMATSLAPNNPVEVLDSIVRVIEKPSITLAELMQDVVEVVAGEGGEGQTPSTRVVMRGIKGPDFPTGGTIMGRRGIVDAYETGRGRVTLRGSVRVEALGGGKGEKSDRQQLVIERIPYNLGLRTLTERIVEAVKEELIADIADVRNESGREESVRIVVELKRGADAGVVEKQLYAQTPLQQTFSMYNIALVNRQPRTLSLLEMIRCYIEHRAEVIRRRTAFLLNEARKRAHLLEGMIFAVCDIDEVIRLIRASRTRQEAIEGLMARRFRVAPDHKHAPLIPARLMAQVARAELVGGVALSRVQAETIGNMRLIQLVGLEIEKLAAEYRGLVEQIEHYERVLATPAMVLAMIKEDCAQMRARYNRERLTAVQEGEGDDLSIAALIPVQDMVVTMSGAGYVKRVALVTYGAQGRGGKGIIGSTSKEDDFAEHLLVASTHDDLLCFTDTGRVFKVKVYQLPELDRTSKGRPIVNTIDLRAGERVRALLAVKDFEAGSNFLTFATVRGVIKRTALKAYMNVHKGGLAAIDIREGDALLDVALTTGTDDVLLATDGGMAIRFNETDARDMGRTAGGVRGIDLDDGGEVVGLVTVPMRPDGDGDLMTADTEATLLSVTRNGYGKRTPIDEYRVQPEVGKPRSQSRGGKGRIDIRTEGRNGSTVAAVLVHASDDVMVITRQGQMVRMKAGSISQYGRGTQGVRVVSLNAGDEVVAVTRVAAVGNGGGNGGGSVGANGGHAEGPAAGV
jgi:DNA gyrase subunit A